MVTEWLSAMPQVTGAPDQVFAHLLIRSGLLREPMPGAVGFVHRTFQDYLGAKAAVEERDFGVLVRNAHDDTWDDVVRMAVGHARVVERARLLRQLMRRADHAPRLRHRLVLLAAACLEHAPELDPAVRADVEERARESPAPAGRYGPYPDRRHAPHRRGTLPARADHPPPLLTLNPPPPPTTPPPHK
ncbi:hypothetical protein GCM10010388_14050 [Streptomyces mauvecolor]